MMQPHLQLVLCSGQWISVIRFSNPVVPTLSKKISKMDFQNRTTLSFLFDKKFFLKNRFFGSQVGINVANNVVTNVVTNVGFGRRVVFDDGSQRKNEFLYF